MALKLFDGFAELIINQRSFDFAKNFWLNPFGVLALKTENVIKNS